MAEEVLANEFFVMVAEEIAEKVNYIGLVDYEGNELDANNTDYERQPVNWIINNDGSLEREVDTVFDVHPDAGAGDESQGGSEYDKVLTITGWRLFAEKDGGVEYGGLDIPEEEYLHYFSEAQFTLPKSVQIKPRNLSEI